MNLPGIFLTPVKENRAAVIIFPDIRKILSLTISLLKTDKFRQLIFVMANGIC